MTDDARIRGREDLEAYVGHFNAKRYDQQIAYYHPEVLYKVGSIALTSPEAIKDFYADFHTYSKEHVAIADFAMTGDKVAVSLPSVFEPFRDYEKNGLGFKAGTKVEIVSFAFYYLKDGKIWRIRVARYNGPFSDFTGPVS
jgi:hypothetical protein